VLYFCQSMASKKLQKKLVEDTGLSVLIACLVVIVAAPFYVYAVSDLSNGTVDLGGINTSLRAVKDSLEVVRERVDMLNSKLDTLSSRLETVYSAESDPVTSMPGVAECLDACRKTTASCFSMTLPTSFNTSSNFAAVQGLALPAKYLTAPTNIIQAPTTVSSGGFGQFNTCQTRVEACANTCRSFANTLACDTTCAIQLGACVKGALSDRQAEAACRAANLRCLTSVCPRTVPGARREAAPNADSPDICRSQCLRFYAVCRQANRLSSSGLTECDQIKKYCDELACAVAPAATGQAQPQPPAQNIVCENNCTSVFLLCRDNAAGNGQALELCNSNYGDCRNQCLIQSGGGFNQETTTSTASTTQIFAPQSINQIQTATNTSAAAPIR